MFINVRPLELNLLPGPVGWMTDMQFPLDSQWWPFRMSSVPRKEANHGLLFCSMSVVLNSFPRITSSFPACLAVPLIDFLLKISENGVQGT